MITSLAIQLAVALSFMGIGLPGFFNPKDRKKQAQFLFGVILLGTVVFGFVFFR